MHLYILRLFSIVLIPIKCTFYGSVVKSGGGEGVIVFRLTSPVFQYMVSIMATTLIPYKLTYGPLPETPIGDGGCTSSLGGSGKPISRSYVGKNFSRQIKVLLGQKQLRRSIPYSYAPEPEQKSHLLKNLQTSTGPDTTCNRVKFLTCIRK